MLVPFQAHHFSIYQDWFSDASLAKYLGPLDDEWLQCVLDEKDGAQYALLDNGKLVGVAGMKYSTSGHAHYVLTDIAIAPQERKKGYGAKLLMALFAQHHELYWLCYIDPDNSGAIAFFTQQGWQEEPSKSDAEMLAFRYPSA